MCLFLLDNQLTPLSTPPTAHVTVTWQLNHEVTERLGAGIQATGQVAIQEYIHGKFTYTRAAFLVFGDQGQARINLETKKPTVR